MYESGGYDFDYRPDFSTAWQDSAWAMINAQMREMADLARCNHFRLFLVVVPFAEQYRRDYLARDPQYVLKPQRILAAPWQALTSHILIYTHVLTQGAFTRTAFT